MCIEKMWKKMYLFISLYREDVERELHLLGFLVMENKLKAGTKETIYQLKSADISIAMATGKYVTV